MAKITDIKVQTKNKERCNIYLDENYVCALSMIVVIRNRLIIGNEITETELVNIAIESDKETAFDYAVKYICTYVPTQRQLEKKLYEKKYVKQVVDYVIEKCKKYGYIDDLKFAKAYVYQNSLIKGKIKLEQELLQKGVKQEYIDEALSGYEEGDGCMATARKKAANKDLSDPKQYAQVVRFLTYRGYAWDYVKECLDKIKKEQEET